MDNTENFNNIIIAGTVVMLLFVVCIVFLMLLYQKRHAEQENAIQKLKEDYKSELISAMVETQERDKIEFVQEMHDNFGSKLSTVRLRLQSLYEIITVPELKRQSGEILNLTDDVLTKMRRFSKEIMSPVIEKLGLSAAMLELCKEMNTEGKICISFYIKNEYLRQALNQEVKIYSIAREMLTNIIKHTPATRIIVTLEYAANLVVSIEDDGTPIVIDYLANQNPKNYNTSMGIKGIASRLIALNAKVETFFLEPQGTKVEIHIPYATS